MGLDRRETGWFYPPTTWYERRIPQKHRAETNHSFYLQADDRQFAPQVEKTQLKSGSWKSETGFFFMQRAIACACGKVAFATRTPTTGKTWLCVGG